MDESVDAKFARLTQELLVSIHKYEKAQQDGQAQADAMLANLHQLLAERGVAQASLSAARLDLSQKVAHAQHAQETQAADASAAVSAAVDAALVYSDAMHHCLGLDSKLRAKLGALNVF